MTHPWCTTILGTLNPRNNHWSHLLHLVPTAVSSSRQLGLHRFCERCDAYRPIFDDEQLNQEFSSEYQTAERQTNPVQNKTTSASSSLPSSNFNPFSVNPWIWLSFFNFILPSMMYWLPPTSSLRGFSILSLPTNEFFRCSYPCNSLQLWPTPWGGDRCPCIPC